MGSRVDWAGFGRASADLVGHLIARSERIARDARTDFAEVRREAESVVDAAWAETRSLGAALRAGPRYVRLASVVARGLTRHRVAAARAANLESTGASRVMEHAHRRNAREIYRLCADLRGGLLKIGQLLSVRADLLPPPYVEELARLQDRAPPVAIDEITPIVEAELGAPIAELFAQFDPEPIAAASLAQVHAAVLADGREVAVKVQLPGIEDLVRADLAALRYLVGSIELPFAGLDVAVVDELARFLDQELDFALEADRARRFASLVGDDQRWRVPHVIGERCSRRVLTLERISGPSLAAHLGAHDDGGEHGRAEIARLLGMLVELTGDHILRRGLAHGDPHPGNFIVEPDGTLVFLDFGCVLEIEPAVRDAYRELVLATLTRDRGRIARGLESAGFRSANGEALVAYTELLLDALRPDQLATIDPRDQLRRAVELAGEVGDLEMPSSFVLISRIFGLLGGLLFSYRPEIDLSRLIAAALAPPADR